MSVSSLVIQSLLLPPSAAGSKTSPVATYLGRLAPGSRRGQLDALTPSRAFLPRALPMPRA
jgi:hypothetical protein